MMSDTRTTIEELKNKVQEFVRERDWERFHSPKNLSMSLAIEAAELMESFQWLTTEESKIFHLDQSRKRKIREEVADIALYLLDLCNILKIDLSEAVVEKLLVNSRKYPVDLAKGRADKWTRYKEKRDAERNS